MNVQFQNPMKHAAKLATAAAVAALLGVGNAAAQPVQETFKIAIIMPFSGAYGIIGQMARRGIEVAFEERGNKVLGNQSGCSPDGCNSSFFPGDHPFYNERRKHEPTNE